MSLAGFPICLQKPTNNGIHIVADCVAMIGDNSRFRINDLWTCNRKSPVHIPTRVGLAIVGTQTAFLHIRLTGLLGFVRRNKILIR